MKIISGGVCAAKGFQAGGMRCGIKESRAEDDTAIILSDCECTAAAVYTMNRVKAAPLYVTMEHLENGVARGIVANAGNANACAPDGMENARRMAKAAAGVLQVDEGDLVVASTGVIGQRLPVECIETHLKEIELSNDGSEKANHAIMTTDTKPKTAAVEFTVGGKVCRIGGICKGSGMIHPNMGTMLSFLTTDCAITHEMLLDALQENVKKTYNRVTVDGDTSTNDMCVVLANGKAGNELIEWQDEEYQAFCKALGEVNTRLARQIAADGEGATKLVTCTVQGARTEEAAERLAKAVVGSNLVKAAMFGADANWGRVLCAMGYSKAPFRPEYVTVTFSSDAGSVTVCEKGAGLPFDEQAAKTVLSESEVAILVDLNEGVDSATAWGCDLTYDYVKINGDYRT
ncbi:bifunctional glutamate N-acetyltransferase/amino-acid acetyltransferase ArgJ [Agathobaculum sp.]|uniref:bifunctional glutamate N-acetyltransferase/amino-acid acetyltransferase ArgJ n=1 Tax=Agathobaculum sp. TaxID=2048138 RepID=UPI002A838E66|nr:bifunctional glutamate N-acetyltransferase/amino-acid acetyltransferase ArgJ [Agathobaculum sp.]MDY3617793.1 bifunctional glutamate N-acetyltransferase/amino-acid acetyltransferase ArgJ [Agathobaculum sp.]